MATTVPPSPSASSPEPLPPLDRPPRRARNVRIAAFGALVVVLVIVLVIVLGGGGGATYYLNFAEAGQLVRGDQVQVGGVPVGTIDDIALLPDYRVRIRVHIESSLVPLHEGTSAEIRVPSLSSVANRYIALSPGPNNRPSLPPGSTLPTSATHGVVDLDQLFNTLNLKTRTGLQQFIQGSAEQYAGAEPQLQESTKYFPPLLSSFDHLVNQLSREEPALTRFLVETAKATTTLAARRQQISEFVGHADTTFAALGSEQSNLAEGLKELPVTLKAGNRTFEELPVTLAALRKLVDVSKPNTKQLASFFGKLRPFIGAATPVVGDFSEAISKPGDSNDLTEVALALPKVAQALTTASPDGVQSLEESLPVTALFGPYTPDLQGLLRDFGQAGAYYDANGHYARVGGMFPDFELGSNNTLKPTDPKQVLQGLKTGQLRRCPGSGTQPAADGSSPFTDNGVLGCDPTETP